MNHETSPSPWSLEVVRGADSGRRYALGPGGVVLGNALNGDPGIDLSDLEANSPRRMAAKQAMLQVADRSLTLRDLDSPGGTFLNRRRLLAGSVEALDEGDVIQLGGVQLRVGRGGTNGHASRAEPMVEAPRAGSAAFPFTLRNGATCRSWDDFLAVSAQSWGDLRDELTSGRLSAFVAGLGRSDLLPDPRAPGSPDERLDAWIGRLPTTRPSRPELEVHPRSITLRATPGGGVIRRKIQMNNVGYRMLRGQARVDPASAGWLRIAGDGADFAVVEGAEVAFEATIPEAVPARLVGSLTILSNGGDATIAVVVEPAGDPSDVAPTVANARGIELRDRIAAQSARFRLATWPAAALIVRLAIAWASGRIAGEGSPALAGPALLLGATAAIAAVVLAIFHKAEARDLPTVAFAGAIAGAMGAAILVAIARTFEPQGSAWFLAGPIWAGLGAILAGLSLVAAPPSNKTGASS